YNFVDRNPTRGASYYRIRQVDNDGKESYSNVSATLYGPVNGEVSVFPNPSEGSAYLRLDSRFLHTETRLTITDASGKLIRQCHVFQENEQPFSLASNMVSGVYYITLSNTQYHTIQKLIVR
ncbi:T9SS type A sorting domain-containing protein, partial [Roseivirga sp. BDSF3-8]|uniref:T9SS type A sorting domain-containing protein n=1 Tax=Roseivirga sp. BDSF3-8 TaxID=3241598 RepID=UPI0035320E81